MFQKIIKAEVSYLPGINIWLNTAGMWPGILNIHLILKEIIIEVYTNWQWNYPLEQTYPCLLHQQFVVSLLTVSEGPVHHLSSLVSCYVETAVGLHLQQQMKLHLKQIDTRCYISQGISFIKQTARHVWVFPQFKTNKKLSNTSPAGVSLPIIIYGNKK